MGTVTALNVPQIPKFKTVAEMLNFWWKNLDKKPFGAKPMKIRHVVETAHAAAGACARCAPGVRSCSGAAVAAAPSDRLS